MTPAHSHTRLQNDWRRFVDDMDRLIFPNRRPPGAAPMIRSRKYASLPTQQRFLRPSSSGSDWPIVTAPKIVEYTGRTYNKGDYDPPHLLPFLTDLFVSMPRNSNVAWYGTRHETLSLFANVWEKLKFTGKILIEEPAGRAASPRPPQFMVSHPQ